MKVFIAHAHEEKPVAREIATKLRTANVSVFLDEDQLPAGEEYDRRIRKEVAAAGVFVFLATKHSLSEGRYSLTELAIAKRTWPNPSGRVLPVLLDGTDVSALDPYLRAGVTVLRPQGNVAAEVSADVERMLARQKRPRYAAMTAGITAIVVVAGMIAAKSSSSTHAEGLLGGAVVGTPDARTAEVSGQTPPAASIEGVFELRVDCGQSPQFDTIFCDGFVVDSARHAVTHSDCLRFGEKTSKSPCTPNLVGRSDCSVSFGTPITGVGDSLALVTLACALPPVTFGQIPRHGEKVALMAPLSGSWGPNGGAILEGDSEGTLILAQPTAADSYNLGGPVLDARNRVVGILTRYDVRANRLEGLDATVLKDLLRANHVAP